MQEYIINGLLIVVALLAVILQIIGMRPSAGMTKKQKVMLWRILTATVLLLILQILGAGAFEVFGSAGVVSWTAFPGDAGLEAEQLLLDMRDQILGGQVSAKDGMTSTQDAINQLLDAQ